MLQAYAGVARSARVAASGVALAVIVQLAAVLLVCAVINAYGATNKLNVGYLTVSSAFGVLWVTRDAGIFDKNGLDVGTVYVPPAVLTQSMLAKEIAIGFSGGSSMIDANLRGADFVLLGSLEKYPSLNYLVTRREITQPHELKGKKLGISRFGAAPHRILELTLAKLGIDAAKNVTFLQLGNPGVVLTGIKDGRVDAGLVSPDNLFTVKKLGLHVLLDLRQLSIEYLTTDIVTTRSFMAGQPDTVRSFMKAVVEGIHYFKSNKEKSMEVMAKYMKVDDVQMIEAGYQWYAQSYERKPYVSVNGVNAVLEHLAVKNPKAKEAKPEAFFDSKVIGELDRSGFIDSLYVK
jgi:NitT/TauT family transport system substrate-binding protein